MRIDDVMSRQVITVQPGASLKEAARILVKSKVSGLPVVDNNGAVVGVLSEADILVKERANERGTGHLAWRIDPISIVDMLKLEARFVGEAMSSPAITIESRRPVAIAAELMISRGVNRLPVVDPAGLVGIVTRSDLIKAFARTDDEIARDIKRDVIAREMWLDPAAIDVAVEEGEVVLRGALERRADVTTLAILTRRVPGVVDVRSELTWRETDD